jgi:hypothetical protein
LWPLSELRQPVGVKKNTPFFYISSAPAGIEPGKNNQYFLYWALQLMT